MSLFKRFSRKKKLPFGAGITPDCRYCRYNIGEDDEIRCPRQTGESSVCKSYAYDPLKREPKGSPKLRTYTKADFEL